MLVLQPRISTEMDGPLGAVVCMLSGVLDGRSVGTNVAVMKGIGVHVGACDRGVGLAALITTGVAVKTEGVGVGGRNGVGGLKGPG